MSVKTCQQDIFMSGGRYKMAENEVAVVDSGRWLEAKLKSVLNTDNFSAVKLADVPRDNLVPALNFIMDVIYRLQEKYTVFQEVAAKLEHITKYGISDGKKEITRLENDIKEQEKAIEQKEKEAKTARTEWPGWATFWFVLGLIYGIIPGIVLFVCFDNYYKKNPTEKGLKKQATLLQEAEAMKQKLENDKARLERLNTSLEADIDEQKRSLEAEQNKLALEIQGYVMQPEISWALNALSEDYMDYAIIEQLVKYLQAGRADNLKEAINLFEEELHRGRLENIQREMLETTQASLEATSDVARLSAWTAQHAADIAASSAESAESLRRVEKLVKKGQKKFQLNLIKF